MARLVHGLIDHEIRRAVRRERIFRDRRNPLDVDDGVELYERFRFRRLELLQLCDERRPIVDHPSPRNKALSCDMQVLIALRYYASGCFQIMLRT